MKNIERLSKYIAQYGSENILIHTIYGTGYWIICQKTEKDKWLLSLANPMGDVVHKLGTATNNQHIALWRELAIMEIKKRAASKSKQINELKKNLQTSL